MVMCLRKSLIMQGPVSFSDIGIRAVNTLRVMQFRRIPGGKICVRTKIHSYQQLKLLHTYSLYMYMSKGIFNCKTQSSNLITVTGKKDYTFTMHAARSFLCHGIKTIGVCNSRIFSAPITWAV